MKKERSQHLKALRGFDLPRLRPWLWIWWAFCLLQACLAAALCYGHAYSLVEPIGLFLYPAAFLLITVLVAVFLRPCQPGPQWSYFHGRPISPGLLLRSRLGLIALTVLLPLYLSRLLPLLLVAPNFDSISAYTVFFWAIHLGVVACLSAIAVASKKTSSYLLSAFLSAAGLAGIAAFAGQLSYRESYWIKVISPERAELLWQSGLFLVGALGFVFVTHALYRGRLSRTLGITAVISCVFAALWQPIKFTSDWEQSGHPVPSDVVDVSKLQFETARMNGYEAQFNDGPGSYSGVSRSTPPYWDGTKEWNTNQEHFWFIKGFLDVRNLKPEVAISARLLEARWVAPDGEVIPYDPPSGTHSVTNSGMTLPSPSPTKARLDTLLDSKGEGTPLRDESQRTGVLLYGAWTSTFERFKSLPGRLEIKVKVDFHTHDLAEVLPLATPKRVDRSETLAYLTSVSFLNEEVEVEALVLDGAKKWQLPMEKRWVSTWNWMLHDPISGWSRTSSRSGEANSAIFESLQLKQKQATFRNKQYDEPPLPENRDALQLVHIVPRYLGSTDVELTIEDFALVTEQTIKWAQENDEKSR